jgi:hypothetical protein
MSIAEERVVELTKEIALLNHVSFDPQTASLEGLYSDEISAYRAKKVWIETLEHTFLLDNGHDFHITSTGSIASSEFKIECFFTTACGRYAFWRLTNNQAPEAQYGIETAHIPNAESLYSRILSAPDLDKKKKTAIFEIPEQFPDVTIQKTSVVNWLKTLLNKE